MIERVHRTKDKEPLFERFGVEKEIASTLDRRVDLPSGGYLVFDYAEAFTVVDVNTGSFVGSRSRSSTQRLEDTIVKNNLEAVKEVVRQLRLRDIGGIIVIDFIDMANPKNRQAVEEALRTELERDRTKTYVVEISPLGLVEMTRQKVTDGPRELMTRKCPTCGGDGIVVSDATVALQIERRLRALAVAGAGSRVQAYRIALHPRTLSLLAGPGGGRLAALEESTRRRFYLVSADGHVHADHFDVLAEGRRDDLAPESPLEEGAEVEVKLVEIDRHDGSAAVARLDGYDVVLADAAKLVGKKATVKIGRVLDGRGFATLVAADSTPAADHLRERSREADPGPGTAQGRRAGARAGRAVCRAGGRGGAGSDRRGRRCGGRAGPGVLRGDHGRGAREEADAPRLERRQATQEAGDGRCRAAGRRRRSRRRGCARARGGHGLGGRRGKGPVCSVAAEEAEDPRPRGRRRAAGAGGRRAGAGARGRRSLGGGAVPRGRRRRAATAPPRRRSARGAARAAGGAGRRSRRRRTATARPRCRSRPSKMPRPWNRPTRPRCSRMRASRRPSPRFPRPRTTRVTCRCPSGSRTSTTGREPSVRPDVRYNPAARGRCPRFLVRRPSA